MMSGHFGNNCKSVCGNLCSYIVFVPCVQLEYASDICTYIWTMNVIYFLYQKVKQIGSKNDAGLSSFHATFYSKTQKRLERYLRTNGL